MVLMFIWINVKQQPELPAYNKTEVHRTTSMYKLKYTQILSKVLFMDYGLPLISTVLELLMVANEVISPYRI